MFELFNKKDNIKALMRKNEKAIKKKKAEEAKKQLTPEQQTKRLVLLVLALFGGISALFAGINLTYVATYNPVESVIVDTSRADKIREFITSESTEVYEETIARHNDEARNKKLDIKTVYSAIGREYPFANILNKNKDNVSTKLTKFIYTELKPAIASYNLVNNRLPIKENSETNEIELSLLQDMLNIKDTSLEGFTYLLSTNENSSSFSITVKEGEKTVPIVLFTPEDFHVREINKHEVNLVQGKYSLILKPMEEYNNIRLQNITITSTERYCIIVDTITNKVVKININ